MCSARSSTNGVTYSPTLGQAVKVPECQECLSPPLPGVRGMKATQELAWVVQSPGKVQVVALTAGHRVLWALVLLQPLFPYPPLSGGESGQPVSLPPLDPTHAKPNDASFHGNLVHLPSEVDRTPREESPFQGLVRKWTTSGLWGWGQTRSVSYMEVPERCLLCLPWLSHHAHPLAAGHMLHLDSDVHSKLTAG